MSHTDVEIQRRLDHAASALRRAAAAQPQQIGVCLYCLRAVDLLFDAGAHPDAHDPDNDPAGRPTAAVADGALDRAVGVESTEALIHAALASLAGLAPTEFARTPVHAAARAARRALSLTAEHTAGPPDPR